MLKTQIIGSLGRDAESKQVGSNTVINFSVAHTEKSKDAQGNQTEKTIWVDCAKWGEKTGILPYLKKGTKVYVDGVPDIRTYTAKDGEVKSSLTLRVMSVELLGKAGESTANDTPTAVAVQDDLSCDLPF